MKIAPFRLERYFAQYEFNTPYLLCSSDCESVSAGDLLALESGGIEALQSLWLGYTESRGHPLLREEIARAGRASFQLNPLPALTPERVLAELGHARGSRSLSSHLKSRLGLGGARTALLHELLTPEQLKDPVALARAIQSLPITLRAPRPVAEAISTAGGVRLASLSEDLELRRAPGVFCAGEMLDWEAPTGGYLLTACFATGRTAGVGAAAWCRGQGSAHPANEPAPAPASEPGEAG